MLVSPVQSLVKSRLWGTAWPRFGSLRLRCVFGQWDGEVETRQGRGARVAPCGCAGCCVASPAQYVLRRPRSPAVDGGAWETRGYVCSTLSFRREGLGLPRAVWPRGGGRLNLAKST